MGLKQSPITVAIRTGDTPTRERRQIERHPPDILITTPESLFLLLTSAARQILPSVRWVIVDEIHSMAETKRGAHLALSLERLAALSKAEPQRIGLSATQRPLSETARFLGGTNRGVSIVDAGRVKQLDITVEVPVDDMSDLERGTEVYSGPAAVIGTGNGDPTNHEPDPGSSRKAFAGLCMAIIQSGLVAEVVGDCRVHWCGVVGGRDDRRLAQWYLFYQRALGRNGARLFMLKRFQL